MAATRGSEDAAKSGGLHVALSPFLLGSLIAGVVATLGLAALAIIQLEGGPPPLAPGQVRPGGLPPGPPAEHVFFFVATAIFAVAWIAVIAAACRDQILRRVDAVEARVLAATEEYGEQRLTEGYLDGMRKAQRPEPPGDTRLRSVPPFE